MVRSSQVVKHWPIERTQGLRTAEKGGYSVPRMLLVSMV